MKRFAMVLFAGVLIVAPIARAEDAPRPTDPQPRGDQPRGVRPEGRDDSPRATRPEGAVRDERFGVRGQTTAAAYIASMEDVGLTDDQKKSITAVFETRDKAIKEFEEQNAEKLKTASKAMEEAYKTRDREAIGKVQQEYRDVFEPIHELMRKANDDLHNLLTDEQKAKLQQKRLAMAIRNLAAPVALTDEQVKQLLALAAGNENDRSLLHEKILPALEKMLTPEQKAAMDRQRTIVEVQAAAGTRLNREQSKDLTAAYDELVKDTALGREELLKKLTEKLNGLLTDEQKDAIKNRPALRDRPAEPRKPAERGAN